MSGRFTFGLARVLRHRQRVEDARARDMREAVERHDVTLRQEAAVGRALAAARAALTAGARAGATGAWLRVLADGSRDLQNDAHRAATRTAEEAARVEERRESLVAAARDRRALERLEAMQRAAWQTERRRIEQRENDDIALTKVARNPRGSADITQGNGQ
jgi:flagellar export protein FliJ